MMILDSGLLFGPLCRFMLDDVV